MRTVTDRTAANDWRVAPGGVVAQLLAGVLVLFVVSLLVGATSTGPWWYTWRAWGLVLAALAAGVAVGWALRAPTPSDTARSPRPIFGQVEPQRQDAGRRAMAEALIELHNQVPSDSLRRRVDRALSDAGITHLFADGDVFDPARHLVVDVQWTNDPALDGRVARTLRSGYQDSGGVVRVAEVLVYRVGTGDSRKRGVS